jgi:hypothetical protein
MKNQFTPGPWYYCDDVPDAAIGYRAIVDGDGTIICNPSPMGADNARLIAAAPQMLAALQMVERTLSDDQTASVAPDSPQAIACAAIVRATVAKATGGTV